MILIWLQWRTRIVLLIYRIKRFMYTSVINIGYVFMKQALLNHFLIVNLIVYCKYLNWNLRKVIKRKLIFLVSYHHHLTTIKMELSSNLMYDHLTDGDQATFKDYRQHLYFICNNVGIYKNCHVTFSNMFKYCIWI